MISEQEQAHIRLLSDDELYTQAIELMKGIGKALPPTQVNGLLNVSLANTYDQLKQFVEHQSARTTWGRSDQHVPDFYKKLTRKLPELEVYARSVLERRPEKASREDKMAVTMALAREFIQHLLAENAYRSAMKDFATANGNREQGKPYSREGQRQ